MALRPTHGGAVRRYSRRARVLTDPQSPVRPGPSIWGAVKDGLDAAVSFMRPAVAEEAKNRGTGEALDDFRDGKYQKRRPYTLRSQAYNEAADRVVGAKVRTAWSQGVGDAIKGARSEADLQARLNALTDSVMGDLGEDFSGLRGGLENQAAAMYEMTRGRFGKARGVVARDRKAAEDSRVAARAMVDAAAEGEASPEGAAKALQALAASLAEHGPPDEFTAGGIKFPAKKGRPGTMTAAEIEAELQAAADKLGVQALLREVREADAVRPIVEDLKTNTAVPKDTRDAMTREALAELDRRSQERAEVEGQFMRKIARLGDRPIPPDVPVPQHLAPGVRLQERAGRRQYEIEPDFLAMGMGVASAQIETRLGLLDPAEDAERLEELMAYLGELGELTATGQLVDEPGIFTGPPEGDRLAHGRKEWGDRATALMDEVRESPPVTVEDMEDVEAAAAALLAEGQRHGRAARIADLTERRALERVSKTLAKRSAKDPVSLAREMGHTVGDLNMETVADFTSSVISRSEEMGAARDTLGLVVGADLLSAEAVAATELLRSATDAERVAFIQAIGELPLPERRLMANAFRDHAPSIAGAIVAASMAAAPAAKAIIEPVADVPVNLQRVEALAGPEGAELIADLTIAGVPNAEARVIEELATPEIKDALAGRVAPEDLDESLGAADRILAAGQARGFDGEPDAAEALGLRIAAEPGAQRLASAVQYLPDSPEAVTVFSRMLEEYEALPDEEKPAFLETQKRARIQRNLARADMPLFYRGEELTIDGLKETAAVIVREFRRGAIDEATYQRQGRLIQRLVEELK